MKTARLSFTLVAIALLAGISGAQPQVAPLDEQYREIAGRLIGAALVDQDGWEKLSYLTTRIGHRLSGSSQLDRAVQWAHDGMKAEGLNPRLQAVKVPRWVRGRESAQVVIPVEKPLRMLGLGGSVATPPEGITAPVVVVGSFDEMEAMGRSRIRDRIVLFDMPWDGYGRTVQYRTGGAARAAKFGAVAVLVRSVTGVSLYSPHTGEMNYDTLTERIPAAAITVEDAAWIRTMSENGQTVTVRLAMEARALPDSDSANVIGEIVGRELPGEVVVVGGHLDSWDIGQGAHDDGAGVIAAWQALTLIRQLGLQPRRTIRVVLWTNEENGTRGARAYRSALGADVASHVAAIEMDSGAERPVGFGFVMPNPAQNAPASTRLKQIAKLLEGIDAGAITTGEGGADIEPLMRDGVPGLDLQTTQEHYFDWHHTEADTLDKIDPRNFRRCIASLAVMAYVLADMPGRLAN
jgi:Zn-dependent M28 family amino/carboxypeptidase